MKNFMNESARFVGGMLLFFCIVILGVVLAAIFFLWLNFIINFLSL